MHRYKHKTSKVGQHYNEHLRQHGGLVFGRQAGKNVRVNRNASFTLEFGPLRGWINDRRWRLQQWRFEWLHFQRAL